MPLKLRTLLITAFGLLCLVLLYSSRASALVDMPAIDSISRGRVCMPIAGAGEILTATAAASDTNNSALTERAVYMLSCRTDTYVRWCTTNSCTAASGDFELPAFTVIYFGTGWAGGTNANVWIGARNVTTNGQCTILECQ